MEKSFENLLNKLKREKMEAEAKAQEARAKAQVRQQEQAEIQQRTLDARRIEMKTAQGKLFALYQSCGIETALVFLYREIAYIPKYNIARLTRELHCVRPQGYLLHNSNSCSQWYYDSAKREPLQPLHQEIVLADDYFIDTISWILTLNETQRETEYEQIITRTRVDASVTAKEVMVNSNEVVTATQQAVQLAVVDAFRNPRTVEQRIHLGPEDDGTGRY